MFQYLFVFLSVCLIVYLILIVCRFESVYLLVYYMVCLSVWLFKFLCSFVHIRVCCVFVCLSIYPSIKLYLVRPGRLGNKTTNRNHTIIIIPGWTWQVEDQHYQQESHNYNYTWLDLAGRGPRLPTVKLNTQL